MKRLPPRPGPPGAARRMARRSRSTRRPGVPWAKLSFTIINFWHLRLHHPARRLAFVRNYMLERRTAVAQALAKADQARREAEALRAEWQRRLEQLARRAREHAAAGAGRYRHRARPDSRRRAAHRRGDPPRRAAHRRERDPGGARRAARRGRAPGARRRRTLGPAAPDARRSAALRREFVEQVDDDADPSPAATPRRSSPSPRSRSRSIRSAPSCRCSGARRRSADRRGARQPAVQSAAPPRSGPHHRRQSQARPDDAQFSRLLADHRRLDQLGGIAAAVPARSSTRCCGACARRSPRRCRSATRNDRR